MRVLRGFHRLGRHDRHAAEVINLFRDLERVREFFRGVHFKFLRDIHVGSALQHLAVDDVGNDRLVFAGEVFVQEFNQPFASDVRF